MELAKFSDYLIPVLLAGAALYALCRRVDVFSALTTGAGEGLSVVLRILPPLVALLTAVYMFQVVLKAWFPRTDAPAIPEGSAHEAGWMMTVPTAVLAAACLVMGLFPQWLLDVIGKAVGL